MKTNKLEAQSRVTQKNIIRMAEKLFFSQGYAQTSVDDICKAAGVTKGAFYHHFKNKDSVYRMLFIHRLDEYLEQHYVLSDTPTAHERFLKLAQCTFASGLECGKELISQSMIGLLTEHNSQLYQQERAHTRFLTAACDAAFQEGLFHSGMTLDGAMMLYACLMNGFLFKWASASDSEEINWELLLETEMCLLTRRHPA